MRTIVSGQTDDLSGPLDRRKKAHALLIREPVRICLRFCQKLFHAPPANFVFIVRSKISAAVGHIRNIDEFARDLFRHAAEPAILTLLKSAEFHNRC